MRQSAVHAWPTRRASVGTEVTETWQAPAHVTRTLYVRRGRWSIDNNRGPVPARELGSCARPSRAAVLATPIGTERRRHAMRYMRGKLTRPLPFAGGAARALPHLRSCARSRVSPRRRVSAPVPRLHPGHQGAVTPGDCALRCGSLVSSILLSLTNALAKSLAKSLTASCLLCQIQFGSGPDECSVSRAFSCVV